MALEELQDLKGVWFELSKIWEKIEDLKEKPWLSVAPRKIRQELDGLLRQLRPSQPDSRPTPHTNMFNSCSRCILR